MTPSDSSTRRYRFRAAMRLHGSRQFDAVLSARVKKECGPIAVAGVPNEKGFCRLGLSVSRRVGTAVVRNRIKRLLREAFRLSGHDWPRGYDLVVLVRPHEPATLAEYQRLLFSGVRGVHQAWEKRGR